MKAAVFKPGTMTMQWDFASRSCGMPLSGVAITLGEHLRCLVKPSLRFRYLGASSGVIASAATKTIFICYYLFGRPGDPLGSGDTADGCTG